MRLINFLFYPLCLFGLLSIGCDTDPAPVKTAATTETTTTTDPGFDQINRQLADNPNNAALLSRRAALYYDREGYDEAIIDLQKALTIDSANVDYLHQLADVYLDYYKSRKALQTMQRAVDLYPERIPTLLKMSEFQLILTMHDESMRTIDRILQLDPQNAEAYFMMGRVFEEMDDPKRAINAFQSSVDNDPDLIDSWLKLGELFAQRDNPIAVRYLDNALRIDSNRVDVRFAKAAFLHDQGNLNEAIASYRSINSIAPQFADAYYNAGLAYLEMDSIAGARRQFDMTVKMAPTHYMGYFYRGVAAEMGGDKEAARQNYQQALNLNPGLERAQQAISELN